MRRWGWLWLVSVSVSAEDLGPNPALALHGKLNAQGQEESPVVIEDTSGLQAARDEKFRPADWHSLEVPIDRLLPNHQREELATKGKKCSLEVVELKRDEKDPPAKCGPMLLTPGLVQNGHLFDLIPDPEHPKKQISYARYLAKKFGVQIYMLHMRGVSKSCYPPGASNLDDLASVDVPAAIDFVSQREGRKVHFFGHSEGGIVGQAALAGLTTCADPAQGNCFDEKVARSRQAKVASAGFFGANVKMSSDKPSARMRLAAAVEPFLTRPASLLVDRAPVGTALRVNSKLTAPLKAVTRPIVGEASPANYFAWNLFYDRRNVPHKVQKIFREHGLDTNVPLDTFSQYAEAVRGGNEGPGIVATGGESYQSALKNISEVPVAVGAFRGDAIAPPDETKRDDYAYIGRKDGAGKSFFSYAGLGHEDTFMNANLHDSIDRSIRWMLEQGGCPPAKLK